MIYIETVSKGLIGGILTAYLLFYGLRPSVAYPDIILEPLEHNWIFIILLVINYYLFLWNFKIGILMLLCIFALFFDMYVFTYNNIEKKYNIVNNSPIIFDTNILFTGSKENDNNIKNNLNIYDLENIKNKNNNLEYIPGDPSPFI
jgi:hypothetical protein